MISSADDYETASEDELINELDKERADVDSAAFRDEPATFIPDVPETQGLLTQGKQSFSVCENAWSEENCFERASLTSCCCNHDFLLLSHPLH